MHLVIGAAGYGGHHAAAALADHVRVRTAEIGDDLGAAMEGVEIVHLAVDLYSPSRRRWRRQRRPHPWLASLVRRARAAGVRRLVYLSSTQALGLASDGRVSERSLPVPEHPYERWLAADESWLREQSDPDVVVIRAAQGFGPGEPLLSCLLGRMARGRVRLPGGGRQPRTFLAGADLGRAFHAAAARGEPGRAYLVGGFVGSWRELVEEAGRALSVTPRVHATSYDLAYLAASARTLGLPLGSRCWTTPYLVDLAARPQIVEDGWSRRELSWQPAITRFADGLTELADWVRAAVPGTAKVAAPGQKAAGEA